MDALSTDPQQNRGAQEEAATEPPFLWILSKGCAKESISPSGAITRLNLLSRQRPHYLFFKPLNGCVTEVISLNPIKALIGLNSFKLFIIGISY